MVNESNDRQFLFILLATYEELGPMAHQMSADVLALDRIYMYCRISYLRLDVLIFGTRRISTYAMDWP
jgi:hypothetical protein